MNAMTRERQCDAAWTANAPPPDPDMAPRLAYLALKVSLCEAQNHRCWHCGARTNEAEGRSDPRRPTIEHIIPRIYGGTDDRANLAMVCHGCKDARRHSLTWTAAVVEALGVWVMERQAERAAVRAARLAEAARGWGFRR